MAFVCAASPAWAEEDAEGEESPAPEEAPPVNDNLLKLSDEVRRASTDRALMVWGPSSAKDDGTLAASALVDRLDPTDPLPVRALRISDWVGAARFRIGGSGQLIPCETLQPELPEGTAAEDELDSLITRGRAALDGLDSDTALSLFQLAERRVPCQDTFLSRDTFHAIFFYGGIAAFFSSQPEEAGRLFRQSATINPSHDWSASYGPEPQSTFLSAVQDIIARPRVRVYGDMRGTNYLETRLDGAQLDQTRAFESTVHPGVHLIQAVDEDGNWSTFVRQLDEGGSLTFFSAQGAERMILEGPDSVLADFSGTRLGKRARDERLDEIYVVTIDPTQQNQPKVFAWIAKTQEWIRLDLRAKTPADTAATATTIIKAPPRVLSPAEKRKAAMLREPDYRTSTTFGFKYTSMFLCKEDELSAGRCPDGRERQHNYLGGAVGVDIRLIKGLNIDLRVGASFTDQSQGGTLLPELAAGIRYRFLTGTLQPFAGGQGLMLIGTGRPNSNSNDKVTIYGGVLVYGGLDIEFDDGFRVTFEGGGGAVLGGEDGQDEWPIVHGHFALGRFLP
jgi:hypothetical protein